MFPARKFAQALSNDCNESLRRRVYITLCSATHADRQEAGGEWLTEFSRCSSYLTLESLSFGFSIITLILDGMDESNINVSRSLIDGSSKIVAAIVKAYGDKAAFIQAHCFICIILQREIWITVFFDHHILMERLFRLVYGLPTSPRDPSSSSGNANSLLCLRMIASSLYRHGHDMRASRFTEHMISCCAHHLLHLGSSDEDMECIPHLIHILAQSIVATTNEISNIVLTFIHFAVKPDKSVAHIPQYAGVLNLMKLRAFDFVDRTLFSQICVAAINFTESGHSDAPESRLLLSATLDLVICRNLDVNVMCFVNSCLNQELMSELITRDDGHETFLHMLLSILAIQYDYNVWATGDIDHFNAILTLLHDILVHICSSSCSCTECYSALRGLVLHVLGYPQNAPRDESVAAITLQDKGSIKNVIRFLLEQARAAECQSSRECMVLLAAIGHDDTHFNDTTLRHDFIHTVCRAMRPDACTPTPVFIELLMWCMMSSNIPSIAFEFISAGDMLTPCQSSFVASIEEGKVLPLVTIICLWCQWEPCLSLLKVISWQSCRSLVTTWAKVLPSKLFSETLSSLVGWARDIHGHALDVCLDVASHVFTVLNDGHGSLPPSSISELCRAAVLCCKDISAARKECAYRTVSSGAHSTSVSILSSILRYGCRTISLDDLIVDSSTLCDILTLSERSPHPSVLLDAAIGFGLVCLVNRGEPVWASQVQSWMSICSKFLDVDVAKLVFGDRLDTAVVIYLLLRPQQVPSLLIHAHSDAMLTRELSSMGDRTRTRSACLCFLAATCLVMRVNAIDLTHPMIIDGLLIRAQEYSAVYSPLLHPTTGHTPSPEAVGIRYCCRQFFRKCQIRNEWAALFPQKENSEKSLLPFLASTDQEMHTLLIVTDTYVRAGKILECLHHITAPTAPQ